MFTEYVRAALSLAKYERMPGEQGYFGEIPGFQGVWAQASSKEACRKELQEVLEEWVLFRVSEKLELPTVKGLDLSFREAV